MTNQEIIEWQRQYREWSATPAGAICERALRAANNEGHYGNDEYCSTKRWKDASDAAKVAAEELRALLRKQQSDLDAAQSQLPEGMKHCTIKFKECEVGHGRLMATNWLDNGCPYCALAAAQKRISELHHALTNLYVLVRGECPSLLENDHHDEMVLKALAGEPR